VRVPKRADHEQRRRQIADALLRMAATRGLHATGMREVAAEAGVSLRLVQYYFGTKEELLLAAMQHLAARFGERAMARVRQARGPGGPASPRDVIAAILAEALPADDDRRTFYVVYTAYLALSLTDPALAIAPLVKNSDTETGVVAGQLRAAQAAGDTPAHLDPDLEAFSLMAMSAGLATSVLTGQSSIQQAQAVHDYHLDRLFPVPDRHLQLEPDTPSGLHAELLDRRFSPYAGDAVRTVRVVSTRVAAGGCDDAKEIDMKVASRWRMGVLMAGALAGGLVMIVAPVGASAASLVTGPAASAPGLAVFGGVTPGVPGLACQSETMCLAVVPTLTQGNIGRPVVTGEVWNGASWTAEPIAVPAGAISASVSGVSCPSGKVCMVVVSFVEGNPDRPYVVGEQWNGTSWTAEPIPVLTGG